MGGADVSSDGSCGRNRVGLRLQRTHCSLGKDLDLGMLTLVRMLSSHQLFRKTGKSKERGMWKLEAELLRRA